MLVHTETKKKCSRCHKNRAPFAYYGGEAVCSPCSTILIMIERITLANGISRSEPRREKGTRRASCA